MFQPDQATLLAWTSSSVPGNLQRYPEINQPHLDAVRPSAGEHTRIRGLALPIGLAILFPCARPRPSDDQFDRQRPRCVGLTDLMNANALPAQVGIR